MGNLPAESELLNYFVELSNWGRWGKEDQLGTLNFITAESIRRAAGLIVEGTTVSMARILDPSTPDELERNSVLQRYMIYTGEGKSRLGRVRLQGAREYIGMSPHGSSTHMDALSHMMWEDRMYNGFPAKAVNVVDGASQLSIHNLTTGVTGRGVLLDVTAVRGVDWLEPGDGAFPEDLEAAEKREGVRVGEGDILILYTGNFRRTAEKGLSANNAGSGYSAACLPWFYERGVALISSDSINDKIPSGYDSPDLVFPIHAVGLVAMGMPLVDNMELGELVTVCNALSRWEFFFSMNTWRFVGATSSPVNPVAIF